MGLLACNVPRIKYRVKLEKIDSRLNSDLGWPNYVNVQASPNPSTSPIPVNERHKKKRLRVEVSNQLRRRKDLSRHASLPQSPPLSQLKIPGSSSPLDLLFQFFFGFPTFSRQPNSLCGYFFSVNGDFWNVLNKHLFFIFLFFLGFQL